MYIGFPLAILIIQIVSKLPMDEFLHLYELTNMSKWNFNIFVYVFIGYFSIDLWTHRFSKNLYIRYIDTGDWKWEHLSRSVIGFDYFLHMIHLFLIYNMIFLM